MKNALPTSQVPLSVSEPFYNRPNSKSIYSSALPNLTLPSFLYFATPPKAAP
jgi:hypothetical protein